MNFFLPKTGFIKKTAAIEFSWITGIESCEDSGVRSMTWSSPTATSHLPYNSEGSCFIDTSNVTIQPSGFRLGSKQPAKSRAAIRTVVEQVSSLQPEVVRVRLDAKIAKRLLMKSCCSLSEYEQINWYVVFTGYQQTFFKLEPIIMWHILMSPVIYVSSCHNNASNSKYKYKNTIKYSAILLEGSKALVCKHKFNFVLIAASCVEWASEKV